MENDREDLMRSQVAWAKSRGMAPDTRGYLATVGANLFAGRLSDPAERDFRGGGGHELGDGEGDLAKMCALHSSSALAVNVFDYWAVRDRAPLQHALRLDSEILCVRFEQQFPTGLGGTPPHLDVVLEQASDELIAIECKFTEWMPRHRNVGAAFSQSYFPGSDGLWASRGLPRMQALAEAIHRRELAFEYLDAPQLLKHALGLGHQSKERFRLWYLYFEWPGKAGQAHRKEIENFVERIDSKLQFRALPYQALIEDLAQAAAPDHSGYIDYLRDRYCRLPLVSEAITPVPTP